MTLKQFLLNESDDLSEIIEYINNKYTQGKVDNMFDKEVENLAPADLDEEEYENAQEWYEKEGNGEAEEKVVDEIVQEALRKTNKKLNSSQHADLLNYLYNRFEF